MNGTLVRLGPVPLLFVVSTAATALAQQPPVLPQPAPAASASAAPSASAAAPQQAQPSPPPPASAQQTAPQQAAPQAQPSASAQGPLPTLPSQAPRYVPPPEEAPPPAAQWTYTYPTGQWVYTTEYGWIWVPNEAASSAVEGVPYVYLYTPSYGWTWYVSPWGYGPYRYGIWVRHPWHPVGWRGGWVAHPRVVVRLGGHGHYYRGGWHGGHGRHR